MLTHNFSEFKKTLKAVFTKANFSQLSFLSLDFLQK